MVSAPAVGAPVGAWFDDVSTEVTRLGLIARGRRTSSSSTVTTETGVLRVPVGALTEGRAYEISTGPVFAHSSVTGDVVIAQIRYTTDGSNPSTSSTLMPGTQMNRLVASASYDEPVSCSVVYVAAAGDNLVLLVTIQRAAGSGNAYIGADGTGKILEVVVKDIGEDTGDVGVDL
jgi:hypothetical protein